jgi:hypothetical protein
MPLVMSALLLRHAIDSLHHGRTWAFRLTATQSRTFRRVDRLRRAAAAA